MTSIAIIGAGVLGRLLAWRLQRQGRHQVHLVDSAGHLNSGNASAAAAGMLAPFCELDHSEVEICLWGLHSLELWPQILSELPGHVPFQQQGSLVVAVDGEQGELARLAELVTMKLSKVGAETEKKYGNKLQQAIKPIKNAQSVLQIEPDLPVTFSSALYFPNEGHIHAQRALEQLFKGFEEAGGNFVPADAGQSIRSTTLDLNGESHVFDLVIDCRGYGASFDLQKLRPVRGEALLIHAPEVKLTRPVRMMHPRYPVYVVPREDNCFFVGATAIESDRTGPISLRSAMNLMSALYALHPGFAEAQILESRAGLRPAFPNHLPSIEVMPAKVIRINGLYRHGYLLSPWLVEQFMDRFNNLEKGLLI